MLIFLYILRGSILFYFKPIKAFRTFKTFKLRIIFKVIQIFRHMYTDIFMYTYSFEVHIYVIRSVSDPITRRLQLHDAFVSETVKRFIVSSSTRTRVEIHEQSRRK